MQRLTLPIPACKVNAGYRSATYKAEWGWEHYGVDLGSTDGRREVRACGIGEVIAAGMDGKTAKDRLGNCIVIVYRDVALPDGRVLDLSSRMFHFDSIKVKAGDRVDRDTVIGNFGNTGANTSGPHLHIEFDTDTQYPRHAVGIAASGKIILRGTVDSTVNPSEVWYLGEGQSIYTSPSWITKGWTSKADVELPVLPEEICPDCAAKDTEIQKLKTQLAKIREIAKE